MPDQITVMQWHAETFELPKGAVRLASNAACTNQLYQIGKNVLGFQFHPEITPQALQLFLDNAQMESAFSGMYIQPVHELKQMSAVQFQTGNQLMNRAIDYVLSQSKLRE